MDTVGRPSILVSAFEPFGGAGVNASQEVAQRLDGLMLANGATIETLVVPVVAGEAERIVFEQLRNRPRPLAYIALGEAGPERVVRLEKVAINWDFFSIPDNAGNQFRDQAIVASGPDAYFATLPFANLHTDFDKSLCVPLQLSLSAGSFLCNHLAYCVSHFFTENPPLAAPFGFVHVPAWRPADGEADLQKIVETVRRVIVGSTPHMVRDMNVPEPITKTPAGIAPK